MRAQDVIRDQFHAGHHLSGRMWPGKLRSNPPFHSSGMQLVTSSLNFREKLENYRYLASPSINITPKIICGLQSFDPSALRCCMRASFRL